MFIIIITIIIITVVVIVIIVIVIIIIIIISSESYNNNNINNNKFIDHRAFTSFQQHFKVEADATFSRLTKRQKNLINAQAGLNVSILACLIYLWWLR